MNQPTVEVADILHTQGDRFLEKNRSWQRTMTLTATEFLRRFVQHILPRGFVRIRQYGFLANRCRSSRLTLARQLLTAGPMSRAPCPGNSGEPAIWKCPRCGAAMQIGRNLTARQLASRCTYFDSS